jgi:magnesium transporter
MIVDCALYRHGRRTESAQATPEGFAAAYAEAQADPDTFVWMGLFEPTAEEFASVSAELRLHPLAVEDALKAHQRPKLEVYESSLFLVLKPVRYDESGDTVEVSEIGVFTGASFVLTVRHGRANPLGSVRARMEKSPEILRQGPTAVMYAVCDAVVDHYLGVADSLHEDLENLEARVFSPQSGYDQRTAAEIYAFKRQTLEFRRASGGLQEPMKRLAGAGVPYVHEGSQVFFRDVSDHLTRVTEHVDSIDRLVTDVLSAHLAQTGVRQNDDMRRISAYAAMAAVPTVVGAVYGMNFHHMPELGWTLGYPAALLVMVSAVSGLYVFFKRRDWL